MSAPLLSYKQCLQEVLDRGLAPVFRPFVGTVYHGTGQAETEAIRASGTWRSPCDDDWQHWYGPAAYFWEAVPSTSGHPATELGHADTGIWAARETARVKIDNGKATPPPGILASKLELERVHYVDGPENDAFHCAVMNQVRRVAEARKDSTWGEHLRDSFVGKLLNAYGAGLGLQMPQAFRSRIIVGGGNEQEYALAILETPLIFKNIYCFT